MTKTPMEPSGKVSRNGLSTMGLPLIRVSAQGDFQFSSLTQGQLSKVLPTKLSLLMETNFPAAEFAITMF